MAYIRRKTINGREYIYLVKGVRDGKSVRQKVIKYLGAVPEDEQPRKKGISEQKKE